MKCKIHDCTQSIVTKQGDPTLEMIRSREAAGKRMEARCPEEGVSERASRVHWRKNKQ